MEGGRPGARCRSSAAAGRARNAMRVISRSASTRSSRASPIGGRSRNMSSIDQADLNLVAPARDDGLRHRRQPRLPLRDLVPRHRRPGARPRPDNGWPCMAAAASVCPPMMIANAIGANVVAVDIADAKLALAKELGAVADDQCKQRGERSPSGDRDHRWRSACLGRCARPSHDLLQLDRELAQARQARPDRPDAGRPQHAAGADGEGRSHTSWKSSEATACRRTAMARCST